MAATAELLAAVIEDWVADPDSEGFEDSRLATRDWLFPSDSVGHLP